MLTKEEFAAFMELVMAFSAATLLSPRQMSILLSVSHSNLCRWMRFYRAGEAVKAYHHAIDPVEARLNLLNQRAEKYGGYGQLLALKPADRVALLRAAITAPAV